MGWWRKTKALTNDKEVKCLGNKIPPKKNVTALVEAVIYSKSNTPCFVNEFEINLHSMRFITNIDYERGSQVKIQLFVECAAILELNGVFLRCTDDGTSIVKFDPISTFEPLSNAERRVLNRVVCLKHNQVGVIKMLLVRKKL